jgi:YidC/Oxa1 family membrane protein insertase
MGNIFQIIFYQPILNLLVFLYNIIPGHDIGLAIVLLTIIIKLVLLPLSKQSIKSQKALQDIQPKIDEIKKKYSNDKEGQSRAMIELYKENKVNPFSSCLPLLIQLPFLFAVFRVFRTGLSNGSLQLVYSFIPKPETINPIAFGFIDLSKPNAYLAVLAGLAQFWQTKMMTTKKPEVKSEGAKDESMMAMMNKQMLYMMPAMTVFIGLTLPGGLSLYWFVFSLFSALQQVYVFRRTKAQPPSNIVEGEVVKNNKV